MARHFGASSRHTDNKAKILFFLIFLFMLLITILGFLLLRGGPAGDNQVAQTVVVEEKPPELRMVEVVVPVRQINAGQELLPALFRSEKKPAVAVNDGIIRSAEQLRGYFAKTILIPGQPLHKDQIDDKRPISAISSSIPPGYRAVTITVNATSSVEGWARPGSFVDIVWASVIRGEKGITTIVQNAKVLSSDRMIDPNNPNMPVPSTVTLLVSSQDAQKIQLARTTGELALSLRGDEDPGRSDRGGSITVADLIGGSNDTRKVNVPNTRGTLTVGGRKWAIGANGDLMPIGGGSQSAGQNNNNGLNP